MKKTIKVYLEPEIISKLKQKAKEVSIAGRAWLTRYLEKLSTEDIAILDENLKKVLRHTRIE